MLFASERKGSAGRDANGKRAEDGEPRAQLPSRDFEARAFEYTAFDLKISQLK